MSETNRTHNDFSITAGLDENGFLRVRKADGTLETVLAGGVRPA